MNRVSNFLEDRFPDLLQRVLSSDVQELEIRDGEWHVRLVRAYADEPEFTDSVALEAAQSGDEEPTPIEITSPLVGTFYRAGSPGKPLVSEGAEVEPDTVVGIIEALQLLTEVEAGCAGTIIAAMATDGQPVEYGQALFQVRPRG